MVIKVIFSHLLNVEFPSQNLFGWIEIRLDKKGFFEKDSEYALFHRKWLNEKLMVPSESAPQELSNVNGPRQ
jgi:hypothetical protein